MAVMQKGAISFGLVYIPVSLHTATTDSDISFNQLHKADKSRIRYKKVCAHCGKEVGPSDIVRGYEYAKDRYVVITDEEIERIKTEKDRTIAIESFVSLDEISPVYYDKSYHVLPQKGGGKALELLRLAMLEKKKAALGKTVMGNSEKLLLIIPRQDGLLIETLLFFEEVKDLPVDYEKPAPSQAELDMAAALIESMETPFSPEKYRDEFQEKLKKLIADKIAGREIVEAKEERVGKALDLMEALKASVSRLGEKKGQKAVRTRAASRKKEA